MGGGQVSYRESFTDWLVTDGSGQPSLPTLVDSFCRFLNAHGFAIKRCNLASETVHPLMTSTRHVWFDQATDAGAINPAVIVHRRQYAIGDALIDEVFFNAGSEESPQYVASPFYQVARRGELYAPIGPAGAEQPFPVFHDLAAIGCTAYFGLKLESFAHMLQKIGLASTRPGGLEPERIDDLRWSLKLLTLHVNTLIEYSIKNTLSRVYVGQDPGRRVCDGMVGLGAVVSMEAAIWFSDLRGFTTMSEGMTAEQLVEALNAYFDVVVGAIYAEGGEVLKYIGDAVLAIFPVQNYPSADKACEAALAAASASSVRLQALNADRASRGEPPFRHGIGLHLGKAQYGNIGSRERLDFTVIGREVNIASRIEGMCKKLNEPVLASGAFAERSAAAMRPLGEFPLSGVEAEVPLFTVEEAGPPASAVANAALPSPSP